MTKAFEYFGAFGGLTRRRFVVAGAVGSAAVLTGSLQPAFAADKPKVGLVMKSLANEFFKQMQAGAEKYAAANADKFEFKAVGMKDERDFAAQVDAIENFVTQKYNIIVVAPAELEGDGHADRQGGEGRRQGDQHRRRARSRRQEGGRN